MSEKYIIKNCPAHSKDALDFCFAKNATQAICYNCTDCVLKQIVELCEQYKKDFSTTNGVWLLANNITNLLDIQEIE